MVPRPHCSSSVSSGPSQAGVPLPAFAACHGHLQLNPGTKGKVGVGEAEEASLQLKGDRSPARRCAQVC